MIRFKKPWVTLDICGEKLIAMKQVRQEWIIITRTQNWETAVSMA